MAREKDMGSLPLPMANNNVKDSGRMEVMRALECVAGEWCCRRMYPGNGTETNQCAENVVKTQHDS